MPFFLGLSVALAGFRGRIVRFEFHLRSGRTDEIFLSKRSGNLTWLIDEGLSTRGAGVAGGKAMGYTVWCPVSFGVWCTVGAGTLGVNDSTGGTNGRAGEGPETFASVGSTTGGIGLF